MWQIQYKRQVEAEETIRMENATGALPYIEEVAFSFPSDTGNTADIYPCFVFDAIIANVNLQLWLSNPITVLCNMNKTLFS